MNKAMAQKGKDVIYVDVDDEITGIIEKLQSSDQRIVALVLPKRATMLQSVVNMKLLKRAGESSKKHIVLITSEAGLLPLAGSVGLHVAKSLQSRPEIPTAPDQPTDDKPETAQEGDAADENEPIMDKSKPIGALAGDDDEAPIELDNVDHDPAADAPQEKKPKKNKKFSIPNFGKFRTLLLLGGAGAIALIALIVWALMVLPKAEIVIRTDSSAVTSSREILLATSESATLDASRGIVPAQSESITRTQRAEVEATGEDNQGKEATGRVVMSAGPCSGSAPSSVPAGTGVTANGLTFITQTTATFSPDFDGTQCRWATGNVNVRAQNPGSQYNISPSTFSVAGRSGVTARSNNAMSGGTDKIVKIVTQADIDKAKQQIEEREVEDVKRELARTLSDKGLFAIEETYGVSTADTQASAQPGEEAENVTVTEEVTYTMLGLSRENLERVIAADVADDIDEERQVVLDYGLSEATFTLQNRQDNGAMMGLRTVVVIGPQLNLEMLKDQVAGKKASEARALIEENPGVTNVDISYGPFWVRSIPKSTGKITIVVEEPEATPDEDDAESE